MAENIARKLDLVGKRLEREAAHLLMSKTKTQRAGADLRRQFSALLEKGHALDKHVESLQAHLTAISELESLDSDERLLRARQAQGLAAAVACEKECAAVLDFRHAVLRKLEEARSSSVAELVSLAVAAQDDQTDAEKEAFVESVVSFLGPPSAAVGQNTENVPPGSHVFSFPGLSFTLDALEQVVSAEMQRCTLEISIFTWAGVALKLGAAADTREHYALVLSTLWGKYGEPQQKPAKRLRH